ncbi:Sporulation domain protein [uncultured Stenotrophomonas sp.]|uniref:Sporulation domain protein n=1 Tax=uncultured Stenotrophomonas sp. TaxID=165438 RepID=A0A1Y5PYN1_9GAMM|nr:Sporulation domain protein [uncultured Stenotrophomonas sp.]
MPPDPPSVDTPLKQRLIGAIVLVALAVIFLPMLIKDPAPDSGSAQDVPLRAPDAPSDGQFETRELPLVAPNAPASGSATGMPAAQPESSAAAPATDDGRALPPAVAAGDYAVNFGAYATEADADAVIAHLKTAGLPGFRQPDTINGRQAWRVRIGPYADRAQAELVRLEAGKVRSDVNAQVVVLDADKGAPAASPVRTETLPPQEAKPVAAAKPETRPEPRPAAPKPEAAKPALPERSTTTVSTAPAASGVGFAVQLGAFTQSAGANALRDKVRAAGFSAFTDQVRRGDGVVLHRVRVGPVANRAEAEQLKAQVAAKVGIPGIVSPHP